MSLDSEEGIRRLKQSISGSKLRSSSNSPKDSDDQRSSPNHLLSSVHLKSGLIRDPSLKSIHSPKNNAQAILMQSPFSKNHSLASGIESVHFESQSKLPEAQNSLTIETGHLTVEGTKE
jgi:hypothetical protein